MNALRIYSVLTPWWPLLSRPEDYAEEAQIYREAILAHAEGRHETMLELGSGGGNNASHLKSDFRPTLIDLSPGMLEVSKALNPECRHLQGDMRTVRLGEEFDAVFIHDAICYMRTQEDLAAAMRTAFVHCRPGGLALFVPDDTKETFKPGTTHGGHDEGERGLRYLQWTFDPDPADDTYVAYMHYVIREGSKITPCGHDVHQLGLFTDSVWIETMARTGFRPSRLPYDHSTFTPGTHALYLGRRRP